MRNPFSRKKFFADDLKEGRLPDAVSEESMEDFFEKRLQNRIKKVLGRNHEIFLEDEDFVYYGYTKAKNRRLYTEEVFKTDKAALAEAIPAYKHFDGQDVRKVIGFVLTKLRPEHEQFMTQDWRERCSLAGGGILKIDLLWAYQADAKPEVRKKVRITVDLNAYKRTELFSDAKPDFITFYERGA